MINPYESPASEPPLRIPKIQRFRTIATTLAVFACILGPGRVIPFLTTSPAAWGWQNWWFGFAPGAYLLFAAAVAVVCEWRIRPTVLWFMPLVLLPLLLVTGLIGMVFYLDSKNIVSVQYILLGLLCPVVWAYFTLTAARAWLLIRHRGAYRDLQGSAA